MIRMLVLRDNLRNANENFHGQQPNAVLIVRRKVLEHRNHLGHHNLRLQNVDKLCEMRSRLPPDHRRVVMNKLGKLLAKSLLKLGRSFRVRRRVETRGRDLRGEPIGLGESDDERNKVFFNLCGREIAADLVEGFNSLYQASVRAFH